MKKLNIFKTILLTIPLVFAGCKDEEQSTPIVLHTSTPTDITETSATIGGKANDLSNVTEVGIAWGKEPEKEFTFVPASSLSEEYSVPLTELRSGTLYYVRAYAKKGDEVFFGELRNFTCAGMLAASLPFNERFRGETFPPLNWNVIDQDGDGYTWEKYDNRFFAALSDSYRDETDLTPENYLVSPKIEVTGAKPILKWSVGVLDNDYYEEHYKVIISTEPFTNNNLNHIGDVVFEETLTEDAYRSLLYRSVDLSNYSNKDIYIAWVHYNCTGQYCIYLTDIMIENESALLNTSVAQIDINDPENITRTSADLTANIPQDGGTTVIEKGFCYSTNPLPTLENQVVTIEAHKPLNATLTDLDPGKTYYVRAFAKNQASLVYSEEVQFSTPQVIVTHLLKEALTGEIPSSWTILDKDGDGHSWEYYEGYGTVCSDSYLSAEGALTPENYLSTPAITIPENATAAELTYEVAASAKNAYQERYKLVISEEPFTLSNCRSAQSLTDYIELTAEHKQENFIQNTVNLTPYIGKTVYIAFLHSDCTDMESLLLKNVVINSYE